MTDTAPPPKVPLVGGPLCGMRVNPKPDHIKMLRVPGKPVSGVWRWAGAHPTHECFYKLRDGVWTYSHCELV